MSAPWAMRVSIDNAPAAGLLRCTHGIQALAVSDALWLRGELLTETMNGLLRRIPGERFMRAPGELLIPIGRKLPIGTMPAGEWMAVERVLVLKVPASLTPAAAASGVGVRLVASHVETAPNVLLAQRTHWSKWVETAPNIRLRPLVFALSQSQAVIRGKPLPNLPGTRYVEGEGVAIPCGFAIAPALGAPTLAQAFGLGAGDLALLHPNGTCEVLPAEVFVAASRSSVRLSDVRGERA